MTQRKVCANILRVVDGPLILNLLRKDVKKIIILTSSQAEPFQRPKFERVYNMLNETDKNKLTMYSGDVEEILKFLNNYYCI